jgi:hypothetical protein
MRPRTNASEVARRAIQAVASKAQYASKPVVKPKKTIQGPRPEHGQQIFVYNHLQTNQVIYSLTRSLNNNASLRQLPYNGKKTVPRALRKDHWHPLAQITFPSGHGTLGLFAFQKLREYRKLHETSWDESFAKDADGKPLTRKARGRRLCDQKANSVADMAAVLMGLEKEKLEVAERLRVEVRWSDLLDAEFAETWSENVVHDMMGYRRNNRDPTKQTWWVERKEQEALMSEEAPMNEAVRQSKQEKVIF